MSISFRSHARNRLLAALAAICVVAAMAAPAAATASSTRWIVPARAGLPTGSIVVGSFPLANALVITSPIKPAGGVAFDTQLQLQSLPDSPDESGLRIDTGVATSGAPAVWNSGELGEQAVVALVDTGVAPVPALENSVVGEIDFSGDGGGDGYGHGTFMASLIAGNHSTAPGAAPHAGILSLKVGRNDGTTSLGSVLGAMQWLHSVGRFAGVRVATLALGVDADTPAAALLDGASDTLAKSGMLIVTAAGNEGDGGLTSPATAAGTFSVGAYDDAGTIDSSDDATADYSGTGADRDGVAQPDISASGSKIVSWIPTDSVIAQANPNARIDEGLLRGSGTSMATAITAGVAALASSARPDLNGAQLAAALRASGPTLDATRVVAAAEAAPAGKGVKAKWERDLPEPGDNGKRKGHDDEADPNGVRWGGVRWGGVRWGGVRWGGSSWADENWEPGTWGGVRWTEGGWTSDAAVITASGVRWGGVRWGGDEWAGVRWGSTDWSGVRWAGSSWSMVEAPGT